MSDEADMGCKFVLFREECFVFFEAKLFALRAVLAFLVFRESWMADFLKRYILFRKNSKNNKKALTYDIFYDIIVDKKSYNKVASMVKSENEECGDGKKASKQGY